MHRYLQLSLFRNSRANKAPALAWNGGSVRPYSWKKSSAHDHIQIQNMLYRVELFLLCLYNFTIVIFYKDEWPIQQIGIFQYRTQHLIADLKKRGRSTVSFDTRPWHITARSIAAFSENLR